MVSRSGKRPPVRQVRDAKQYCLTLPEAQFGHDEYYSIPTATWLDVDLLWRPLWSRVRTIGASF